MNGDTAKKAFKSAEKDLKKKEIEKFKKIVTATLDKLETKKRARQKLDKEIHILKKDIDDLKSGRLDKIEERQENDKEAEEISIFKVIKEVETIREVPYPVPYDPYPVKPWFVPYRFTWCGDSVDADVVGTCINSSVDCCTTINSSESKYNTPGSYKLEDGTVKNI